MIQAEQQLGARAGATPASDEAGREQLDRFAAMDPHKMGMVLFILSESVFFTLLILAYLLYRAAPAVANGPNAKTVLDIGLTAIFSACLFASSGTIWLADRSLARGRDGLFRFWLAATIGLGGIFIFGQGQEYYRLLTHNVTVSQNVFGTTFFTLTGFHGLHVIVGLIALLILLGLALAGQFKGGQHRAAVETIALYWHFVDAVWVVVFSVIYIGAWLS
ncbi:MAG TPA: cytochrome c oxidase subunit 3 [Chloroflexia bacterium]|nr:cytochrome c oxidase subunit 3 [Chloroflexia bacterium]